MTGVPPAIATEIQRALAAGNKIAAIKLYRAATRTSLADAKAAVEAMATGRPVAPPPGVAQTGAAHGTVMALLGAGKKIEAIKVYREATGLGLKEAKDAVEALEARAAPGGAPRPLVERPRRGGGALMVVALVVLAIAAGVAYIIMRGGK